MRILFVDPEHGPRSQMAEALFRAAAPAGVEVASAGTEPGGNLSGVARVLADAGVAEFTPARTALSSVGTPPDLLIAVCEEGCAACPYLPGSRQVRRWPLPDPGAATIEDREALLRDIGGQLQQLVRDLQRELS